MSERTTYSGVGFPGLLTILFIGLKLGGIINWSWWWVLSPLWIMALLSLLVFLLAAGFFLWKETRGPKRRRGNTLIEVLVCAAIIGIIISLVLTVLPGCEGQPSSPKIIFHKVSNDSYTIRTETFEFEGHRYLLVSHHQTGITVIELHPLTPESPED